MLLALAAMFAPAWAQSTGPIGGLAGGAYVMQEGNPIGEAWVAVARLGVKAVPEFDLEAEIGRAEGKTRDLGIVYFLYNPRLNAVSHFTPNQRVDVFFVFGAGLQYVDVQRDSSEQEPDAQDRALYENPSTDFLMNAGPGLTLHLAGPVHLRADARWYGTFGDDPTRELTDSFQNLEFTIGLDLRGEAPADRDGDGIANKYDDCPDDPEDLDNWQDADGCPELDNDRDKVLDDDDDCDEDPEDHDGWKDEDGCPEADNDGDGIRDKKDRCPDDPEDEDGFEDSDGCPEKDNDQDGIVDKKDRCPNDPETFNKFDDKDGCPDDIPVEIKRFTGVIRGITFETNKAVIRLSSEPTLYDALKVFEEYPDLRIEIQGHTDNVGNDEFNLDLSQRRAEAVADWFYAHGVTYGRFRAVGYGETLPIAENTSDSGRAENRRVEFKLVTEDAPPEP
jgi:outer membrane protein OmpA-like peptidoglycan-associated protein